VKPQRSYDRVARALGYEPKETPGIEEVVARCQFLWQYALHRYERSGFNTEDLEAAHAGLSKTTVGNVLVALNRATSHEVATVPSTIPSPPPSEVTQAGEYPHDLATPLTPLPKSTVVLEWPEKKE